MNDEQFLVLNCIYLRKLVPTAAVVECTALPRDAVDRALTAVTSDGRALDVGDQLRDFKQRFAGVNLSYARSKHLTAYDVLKIASMIEAEAAAPRDRPLIASVIYNRLADGMMLQFDSTTRYATGSLIEVQLAWDTDELRVTVRDHGLPAERIVLQGDPVAALRTIKENL